jgi:cell division septum initiation protein DivIVA
VTEQHEEESLRRLAREQAEIERQTDALVLRTLTAMVTAAEDLKTRLKRDTETILEGYRRTKRGLDNDISMATAERQRFRREAEQQRDAIISDAQTQAHEIVAGAERKRETLLAEGRAMEQRLLGLEEQIKAAFGLDATPDASPGSASSVAEPARASFTPMPSFVAANPAGPSFASRPVEDTPEAEQQDLDDIEDLVVAPPLMAETPAPVAPAEPDEPEAAEDIFGDDDEDQDSLTGPVAASPHAVALRPAPAPTPPAPARSTASTPPPASAPSPRPARRRLVELVFDGVPGYQQASALELAVNDLVPVGGVDIVEFEHSQLVLSAQATDVQGLANQLLARSPASLQLVGVTGDRATFRCV